MTNRGVDRLALFASPVHRLVFLSILAAICLACGLRIHAFCLMTNHFHLLVEDPRGLLSHAMLRLQTTYARFFRDTAGRRGSGHIFGDRFWSRPITGAADYRRVVAYILRNPLECRKPLAASAAEYPWSSASAHVGAATSREAMRGLIGQFGGMEAILASLPEPKTRRLERMRLHRMECLAGGEWIEVDTARQGVAGAAFAASIAERFTSAGREGETHEETDPLSVIDDAPAPRTLPAFGGHAKSAVTEALERIGGEKGLPGEAFAYVLWRFARDGRRQLARSIASTTDEFIRKVQRIGSRRMSSPAVNEALGRLEWRMTFALGGAPWRV